MISQKFQDEVRDKFNSLNRRLNEISGSVGTHNILSATHPDSVIGAVVQGDIVIGNATPKWTRLARGADDQILKMNGNNPNWEAEGGGVISESAIQFIDNFADASKWFLWNESHTDANRIITEAGGVLNIVINNGTNGNWSSGTNNAPRFLTGVPGFPLVIETKITAWNENDHHGGGICFSRIDTATTANYIELILTKLGGVIQIYAGYGGGSFAAVAPYASGVPLWLRVYLNVFGRYYSELWFYYSTDGAAWNQVGAGPYSHASWTNDLGIACGMHVKNWTTYPACDFDFDYFTATRLFGPG